MPNDATTLAAKAEPKASRSRISAKALETLVPTPINHAEFGELVQDFKKALIERALEAELSHHLGYAGGQAKPEGVINQRNGSSAKTVLTDTGKLRIDVPRERLGSFEPQLIGKHERRFSGFDDKIIAMYARGMTVREIQGFIRLLKYPRARREVAAGWLNFSFLPFAL